MSLALSRTHTEGESLTLSAGESSGVGGGTNWSNGLALSRQTSHGESLGETDQTSQTQSTALSRQESESDGSTRSKGRGKTEHGDDETKSQNENLARTQNRTQGTGETATTGSGASHADTRTETTTESQGTTLNRSRGGNTSWSEGETSGVALGVSQSDSLGLTRSAGASAGASRGESEGRSQGKSEGETNGTGDGESAGLTISYNETLLAKQKVVQRDSGSLARSIEVQLAAIMNQLAAMPDRMVLVKCKGMGTPFLLRVHEVKDPYVLEVEAKRRPRVPGKAWQDDELRRYLGKMRACHPCYFVPTVDDQAARVRRFLGPGGAAGEPDDADAPVIADDGPWGL